ncbi:MAG: alpha/beta hydrolase [Deltaproteobacteria bacterium]|nr:alpha/beta hydrolase [Deltaproteobacteria bacterium]MBW2551524.1 alpha/beta hydrolase [Deltaproteobacteria bacterium]
MWISEAAVAWAFLGVSLVGAVFTLNAFMPVRRIPILFVPSFFGSWLTAELALHHLVWQSIATVFFVQFGALSSWPGLVGMGITIASWLGLLLLFNDGRKTHHIFDQALTGLAEPADAARMPLSQLVMPFRFGRRGVKVLRNVQFREVAGKKLKLDVVMPETPSANRPAIMQIHGGAWIIGDKREQGWPLIGHLAANGWVCFNVNYRLSPAATWPEHIIDLKYALHWIRQHADEYGIDPNFVAVTGGSAGGHLTAMMALTANDPEYQPGFEDADTSVQAAVPVYAVFDFTNRLGTMLDTFRAQMLEPMIMKAFFKKEPEKFHRASPIDRVHADAPPFLIVHGDRDTLAPVEDAQLFVETLSETSRSPVMYTELRGAQHAFDIFASPRTARMLDGTLRFLTAMRERARNAKTPHPSERLASPAPKQHLAADNL